MSCLVGGKRSWRADRDDSIYATIPHHFLRNCRERIYVPRGVQKLKTNIAPLDVTKLSQSIARSLHLHRNMDRGETDYTWHSRRLLRA